MKKAITITLFLLLSLFLGTSSAVEVTVFGPNQYLRTTGPANVYTDSFSAIPGQGKLIVKNGNWGGSHRITDAVSSASVVVNGEEIFGPNGFNQQVYLLEAPINVAENNSISVELTSNPGSYLTIQVTEQVDPPTATISAAPETIMIGESATLTWTSTNAQSASIDQGIGDVDVSGSTTVSPPETTTYTVTATGLGGTATASVTVTVTSPISLLITSPNDGDTISRPDVMVEGTITNARGNETGVTVNGILAAVDGNQFVANHVPLEEGENTITATATDIDGNTVTTSITISAVTTGNYIRITARPESGVSPLETTLRVEGSFSFDQSSLTHTGPGVVEVLENPSPEEYRVRMTTEGIYYLTAQVTNTQSVTYTDTVAVVVLNQAELDALLKATWNGMRAALSGGDIGEAIDYIAKSNREMYEYNFNLMSSHLPAISAGLQDIELVQIIDGMAEYEMWAEEDGQMYSFYILFVKDPDGIWRIEFF